MDARYLEQARLVMKRLGRLGEWESRIRALQAEYKHRPYFVKALEELFGPTSASARPIINTRHSKR